MREIPYDRAKAVAYAKRWALVRNPGYADFNGMGGDCTNFASQCIFAGCGVMNYAKETGWYYNSLSDRTASWSGVQFLHDFLVHNSAGTGPFAVETDASGILPGDLVQLGSGGHFYHTPVVSAVEDGRIFVAAHTYDVWMKPLDGYFFPEARFLHIAGARTR